MFKTERENYHFQWKDLGDIEHGRPSLGSTMHVAVYRLMQYTLREVLGRTVPVEKASEMLREAGRLAGRRFCENVLDRSLPFPAFVAQLQENLRTLGIGILRIEKSDLQRLDFVLTVEEDLDCSGLPASGETICDYDEGFLAGVLGVYTGKYLDAREVDCWASGERVCRFKVKVVS